MSDLIERQAAIDAVRQYCEDNQIEDGDYHSNGIEYELNNLPPAEPEIVRCKDCVYSSYEPYKDQADVYVCNYSHWRRSEGGLFPDDFCSRGERRRKCD